MTSIDKKLLPLTDLLGLYKSIDGMWYSKHDETRLSHIKYDSEFLWKAVDALIKYMGGLKEREYKSARKMFKHMSSIKYKRGLIYVCPQYSLEYILSELATATFFINPKNETA